MTKKTKAMETPGYFDIAFDLGVEIMESGLIDPALYQKLSDPEARKTIIPLVVQAMRRGFFPEPAAIGGSNDNLDPLPPDHYRVHVDYHMPRDKSTLESEFSKDGVSDLFYGNYEWQLHPSCAGIDQTPDNRIMLLKHFGHKTTSEANIAEMDKLGYRPATHLEAYAFAKANPELQRQFWIVALGSSAMDGGGRYVAVLVLDNDSGRRILGDGWFDCEWFSGRRFLFVRKDGKLVK